MSDPFEASRLKIARGRHHLVELVAEIDAYLQRDPIALIVEPAASLSTEDHDAWTIRTGEPVPHILGPIIGDIVHNFRASLDLLASDLVRLKGKSTKGVYFPFAESEAGLREMIKRRNFDRAGPDAVALLKTMRPWKGGNFALRGLHDLDIADKHEALIPVIGIIDTDLARLLSASAPAGAVDQLKKWSNPVLSDGQIVAIMPKGWGPRCGTRIKANYRLCIVIADRSYDAIRMLDDLARIVEEITNAFAPLANC